MLQENLIGTFERSIKENWELNAFTDYGKNNTRTFGQVAVEIKKLHYRIQRQMQVVAFSIGQARSAAGGAARGRGSRARLHGGRPEV